METDAFYLILNAIQNKKFEMIISPVHFEEVESIEDRMEKFQILELLTSFGKRCISDSELIRKRATEFIAFNLGIADAAHLAFAEQSADYFLTCDDNLLKRSKRINMDLLVVNPIEFCLKEELK